MTYRFPVWRDKLLLFALLALFYTYSSVLRVAIRAVLEGRDFGWAYYSGVAPDGSAAVAEGHGLFGHTDYLLVNALVVLWLLCAGLRKPDRFFQSALVGWTSIGFGMSLWLTFRFGSGLTSSKETLGLTALTHGWTDLLAPGIAWLLSVALLIRGAPHAADHPGRWTALNRVLLLGSVGFLLVAALVLNLGQQHGGADFAGISAIYIVFFLFLLGVSPWERTH